MHRIILEAASHDNNSFVTLTYDDEHLPAGNELVPSHVTLFLKRFRKELEPSKIRYFVVGEYGEQTFRPHYHAAIFGYPSCLKGSSHFGRSGSCCAVCDRLQRNWPSGRIFSGSLNQASAGYIAGYVTKKMTQKDDPRLGGRHPEFTRMSLRPGIGADFMDEVASTLLQHNLEDALVDVPVALQHGGAKLPLGKYLRKRLRSRIGKDEKTPEAAIELQKERLFDLWKDAEAYAPIGLRKAYVKNRIIDDNLGKHRQIEARHRRGRKKDIL